ncbi:MAG: DUF4365 domain-containing protein [Gammaproteobacteria bacterium]|nr:MAG: DUF4365 domain-containing protein [Gammaproteobacteria bacterium]
MKFNQMERNGVYAVAKAITENLGWIFRELTKPDIGIDAHIEICEYNQTTGKILALQIKSGESYFSSTAEDGVFYRGCVKHLNYWKSYSIPTLVVLHNPKNNHCYWQVVDDQYITKKQKTWTLFIPFYQIFDFKNFNVLFTIASHHKKYNYQLANLRRLKPIMIDLSKGRSWTLHINTDSGFKRRKGIPHHVELHFLRKNIPAFSPYEHESDFFDCFTIFGKESLFESVQKLMPWADITYLNSSGIEADEVSKHLEDLKHYEWWPEFEAEAKSELNGDLNKMTLPELGSRLDVGVGYVAKIKINDFGRSFLILDQHLNSDFLNWGDEIG